VTRLRQFVLVAAEVPGEEAIETLLSRCDDASVECWPAAEEAWVAFDREAPTLVDAIVSGVRDLDHAGIPAERVREDDDVVTIGVIAQRVGRSEEAVWRWAAGETGPGGFPAPIVEHPRRPCYLWSEVVPWLRVHYEYEAPDATAALRAVNLVLELRAMAPDVERLSALRSLLST
jgi:hypothetical protein